MAGIEALPDTQDKLRQLTVAIETLQGRVAEYVQEEQAGGAVNSSFSGDGLEARVDELTDTVQALEQKMVQFMGPDLVNGACDGVRRFVSDHPYVAGAAALGTAAAVGAYAMRGGALQAPDLANQSVEVEPGVRASTLCVKGQLIGELYPEVTTLCDGFERGMKVSGDGPCLGARTGPGESWEFIRYSQVLQRARHVGSGLLHIGLSPSNDTFIGIFSNNRIEWVVTEQASNMFSMVTVPLYDTLGTDACSFIINQTSMTTVFCDTQKKVDMLVASASQCPSLRRIIVYENVSNNNVTKAQEHNIELLSLAHLESLGSSNLKDPVLPSPDNMATICYTSGTTGNPKGVMLTHRGLVADYSAAFLHAQVGLNPTDVHLSYLPLAHMFERICQAGIFASGGSVGFFRGDVKLLLDDLQSLRPTIWPTVPRLLNRIYDKVHAGVKDSKMKSYIFNLAFRKKRALLQQGVMTKDTLWDRLVFRKVQDLTGGRIRWMIIGSAPIAPEVLTFARCAFGCQLLEGYGQTEAVAGVTMTHPMDGEPGHVGSPMPCNYVKLCDVPEMDYYAKDNKGEVCVKGINLMLGYFKDEQKTRETIDDEGWLHTGDVGMWTENGTLKIIDRRKHIFKLAQGEYVAPEKLEGVYRGVSLIAQIFVDGDSLQTYTVAVVVPDEEVLPKWAAERGLSGDFKELCGSQALKAAIYNDCQKLGKQSGLKGFEQIGNLRVHHEQFSVENGLLTPTFKTKRPALRRFFADSIQEMYTEGRLPAKLTAQY